MKAVLMSFSHEECEKIFSGAKINKVVKTAPKLKPPFKVYMYEILGKRTPCRQCAIWQTCSQRSPFGCNEGAGVVVGEFVCDKTRAYIPLGLRGFELPQEWLKEMCLSKEQLDRYGGLKTLHGLYITDPKCYDTPKELSTFSRYGYQRTECVESGCGNTQCRYCELAEVIAGLYKSPMCIKGNCIVTRPPRSWCYVEEIDEWQTRKI